MAFIVHRPSAKLSKAILHVPGLPVVVAIPKTFEGFGEVMESLSELQQTIVRQFYYDGLSVREIAVGLGYSESHVRRNLNGTLHLLRRGCNEEYRRMLIR